jgi:dephospho-CoA kinase
MENEYYNKKEDTAKLKAISNKKIKNLMKHIDHVHHKMWKIPTLVAYNNCPTLKTEHPLARCYRMMYNANNT